MAKIQTLCNIVNSCMTLAAVGIIALSSSISYGATPKYSNCRPVPGKERVEACDVKYCSEWGTKQVRCDNHNYGDNEGDWGTEWCNETVCVDYITIPVTITHGKGYTAKRVFFPDCDSPPKEFDCWKSRDGTKHCKLKVCTEQYVDTKGECKCTKTKTVD